MRNPRGDLAGSDLSGPLIIGAGGHARELFGLLHAAKVSCSGMADDQVPDTQILSRIGARYLGTIDSVLYRIGIDGYYIGVGSGKTRAKLSERLSGIASAQRIIHPQASIDLDVSIEPGSVIFAQATVTTNVVIGRHSHVGRGAAVGHDCVIGDFVTVMPLASVSGSVAIGSRATVGSGAVIRQGQAIGEGAYIGAGAVVVQDVPPNAVVVGNPARLMRLEED